MNKLSLKSLTIVLASAIMISCNSEESKPTENNTDSKVDVEVVAYNYENDWTQFNEAVNSCSKSEVISFIDVTNSNLENEVALNYEYFFDDVFKEQIANLNYSELETAEFNNAPVKIVKITHSYMEGDVELDSMYIFYFSETSNGLKIVHIEIAG